MRLFLSLIAVALIVGCSTTMNRIVQVQDTPRVYVPALCEDSLKGATTAQLREMFGEPTHTRRITNVTAMSFNVPVLADHSATVTHILALIQGDRAVYVICQDAEVKL